MDSYLWIAIAALLYFGRSSPTDAANDYADGIPDNNVNLQVGPGEARNDGSSNTSDQFSAPSDDLRSAGLAGFLPADRRAAESVFPETQLRAGRRLIYKVHVNRRGNANTLRRLLASNGFRVNGVWEFFDGRIVDAWRPRNGWFIHADVILRGSWSVWTMVANLDRSIRSAGYSLDLGSGGYILM